MTWITDDLQNYVMGSVYGGHPCPVRANVNAGLYTYGSHTAGTAYFRTVPYDPSESGEAADPMKALPANWPPVPPSMIDVANADYRDPNKTNPDGPDDFYMTKLENNTNGIDEYTASNFGGAMQGDLIAGKNGGHLHRIILNNDGSLNSLLNKEYSTSGGNPLGITCQGDADIFPGSIWVATFDSRILFYAPSTPTTCIQPGQTGYDPNGDYDSDGYTNQDEDDNGTDLCSGASKPGDFDGDLVSDLNDLDDDDDGINDDSDPFQMGATIFDIPIINELFSDNLTLGGYLGLGFTGLMNNGAANPNYLDWLDKPGEAGSPINDVMGGAIGAVTIYQTDGDAFNNDQEKAFQYGVNADISTGQFIVTCRVRPPFHAHGAGESHGLFMGTGFQDNYIKLVMYSGGLKVEGENAGTPIAGLPSGPLPATPTNNLDLFFVVDPAAGTVQAKYAIDANASVNLGTPFSVSGGTLTAIQQATTPLAVGLIGTNGGNAEFAANWDYLNVVTDKPFVSQTLPDITKTVSAPDENTNLDNYFDDNEGVVGLTYTVQTNTNTAVGASITGNTLFLSFPAVAAVSDITIRATDAGGLYVEQTFTVTVSDQQSVLYRVNCGGGITGAIDGKIDWEEDYKHNNSPHLIEAGANHTSNAGMNSYHSSVDLATTPTNIFAQERSDFPGGPPVEYQFPVSNGAYEVRLYMGNSYGGTQNTGTRIFSVQVEDPIPGIYSHIDLSDLYGHKVGAMISFNTLVTDGNLNLKLLHGPIENPLINGIEILTALGGSNPIAVSAMGDVTSSEGENANVTVTASGGTGNLNYSATGLPPGTSIDPTNGLIGGTISEGAIANSPFNVVVSIDDTDGNTNDVQTISFEWTVSGSVFPVEWLSFSVREHQGNAVLEWETASELNNQHFDIERSLDGGLYQVIGRVAGAGNTNNATAYSFTDNDILSLNTSNFIYRLKQVDIDGLFSYSKRVELTIDVPFMGYPVPFADELNIRLFPYRFDRPQIRILSSLGQVVYQNDKLDKTGTLQLDTSAWPSGIYFIHLKSARPNQVFKVLKE